MQVNRTPKTYDVCIIGSGASGGTAAKVLTEGGLSVVMLEAGPPLVPARDYKEHVWPYDLPHRGAGVGGPRSGSRRKFVPLKRLFSCRSFFLMQLSLSVCIVAAQERSQLGNDDGRCAGYPRNLPSSVSSGLRHVQKIVRTNKPIDASRFRVVEPWNSANMAVINPFGDRFLG